MDGLSSSAVRDHSTLGVERELSVAKLSFSPALIPVRPPAILILYKGGMCHPQAGQWNWIAAFDVDI